MPIYLSVWLMAVALNNQPSANFVANQEFASSFTCAEVARDRIPLNESAIRELGSRAQQAFAAEKFKEAAQLWIELLQQFPECDEYRSQRITLVTQVISIYEQIYQNDTKDPWALVAAYQAGQTHRQTMDKVYRDQARQLAEYQRLLEQLQSIEQRLNDHGYQLNSTGELEKREQKTQSSPSPEGPSPPSTKTPQKSHQADPHRRKWISVGLGTSWALTGAALAAALGTNLYGRFEGPLYQEIFMKAKGSIDDADKFNDVSPYNQDDMCIAARMPHSQGSGIVNPEIGNLCNRYDRVRAAAISMWVATGVFAISSAVFTGLAIRERKRSKALARLHSLPFRVAPVWLRKEGFFVMGTMKF